jgi:hypothetical protein
MEGGSEEVIQLRSAVAERDATIAALKDKTKAYIQKLQKDHEDAIAVEKSATQAALVSARTFLCIDRSLSTVCRARLMRPRCS